MRRWTVAASAVVLSLACAGAYSNYFIRDGNGATQTVKSDSVGGVIQPVSSPVDANGNHLATAPGAANTNAALPIQGVSGGVPIPVQAGVGGFIDGAIATLGAQADAACGTDNGSCTLQALVKRLNQRITTLIGSTLTISGTVTANLGTLNGAALDASVGTTNTDLGAPGATACSTDTGSCSLNALLQRVAQRLTTLIGSLITTTDAADGSTGSAVPSKAIYPGVNVGGNLTGLVGDPCQVNAHSYTPINISTAANTKIIAGTASKKTYVCHMFLYSAGTGNVGVVEGTGTNCGTSTTGVIGGATAATGPNLVANQGFALGTGSNAIAATAANADDLCLITSQAVQLSGIVVTVQQ